MLISIIRQSRFPPKTSMETHSSSVFLWLNPVRLCSLYIIHTIPQKEDIILLYIEYISPNKTLLI